MGREGHAQAAVADAQAGPGASANRVAGEKGHDCIPAWSPLEHPGRLGALPGSFEAKDARWGYRDASGNTVIAARYLVAQEFSKSGVAAVADETGWAMIDRRGQLLVRPLVVDNGPDAWSGGLARFVAEGKVGFFDERGRIVIPARYDFALPFSEQLAAVCTGCQTVADGEHRRIEGGRWGFIDRKGRERIRLEFESAESFEHGIARVRKDGVEQRIDTRGRVAAQTRP